MSHSYSDLQSIAPDLGGVCFERRPIDLALEMITYSNYPGMFEGSDER